MTWCLLFSLFAVNRSILAHWITSYIDTDFSFSIKTLLLKNCCLICVTHCKNYYFFIEWLCFINNDLYLNIYIYIISFELILNNKEKIVKYDTLTFVLYSLNLHIKVSIIKNIKFCLFFIWGEIKSDPKYWISCPLFARIELSAGRWSVDSDNEAESTDKAIPMTDFIHHAVNTSGLMSETH